MENSRGRKVLLVEDNHMSKVLVKEILNLNGYQILEARSGAEALKLVSQECPDLVLMDLNLPEMDGITAMRFIKADEKSRNIPVLALTASAMKGDEEKLIRSGFDGYIAKPIDVKKLASMVNTILGGGGKG